jgi:phage protein D
VSNLRLAPDARIMANGAPLPAAMRASVSRITLQLGIEGADRLELTLVNEGLMWLDHQQIALGRELRLSLGYAPDPLEPVFVGDVVGLTPAFPADGVPTLTVVAHDRRARLQRGTKTRWFAVAIPRAGNRPIPDPVVARLVAAENQLIFASDPVSLAISAALGGVEYGIRAASGKGNNDQELVRKQRGENDLAFLARIAGENGWVMTVDHGGALGGNVLRFTSLLAHLEPDLTVRYGENLIEFSPRISTVGEILSVTVRFWIPQLKVEMTVTAGWDWDRQSLEVSAVPSYGRRGGAATAGKSQVSTLILGDEVSAKTAPRVILAKLLSKLNQRLTGSASTVGNVAFRPGGVVQFEGVGKLFGGRYRVTGVTHTLDGAGFRTSIDVRKEVWFDDAHLMRGFEGAERAARGGGDMPFFADVKEVTSR